MKRLFAGALLASLFLLAFSAHAQSDTYKEGTHYFKLDKPLKTSTGDKIEVRELFWYGCPHCFSLEPFVVKWLENKPANAEFVATPAVFSKRWVFHAKAYYTIKALGLEEKGHPLIFDAIHLKKEPIGNVKNLSALLNENFGTDPEVVKNTISSFAVDSNVRAANSISVKSGANGVPTLIVDGKYRLSAQSAGGNAGVFDLVNFLVEKAQSER